MRESRMRVCVWGVCCFVSIVDPRGVSGLQAFDGRLACSFEDRPWVCGMLEKGSIPRSELLLLTLGTSLCSGAREVGEYRLQVHRPFTDDLYVSRGKPFCGLIGRVGNDARGTPGLDFDDSGDVCSRLPFHPEGLPPIEEGKEGTLFVQAQRLSVREKDHVIGDAPRFLHDLGREHDRFDAGVTMYEARDVFEYLLSAEGVYACCGLVEEEQIGGGRKGKREGEAALNASGKLAELLVRIYLVAHQEVPVEFFVPVRVPVGDKLSKGVGAHLVVAFGALGDVAYPPLYLDLVLRKGTSEQGYIPRVGVNEAHQNPEQGALAGAVGPHYRHDVAGLYLQVYGPELEASPVGSPVGPPYALQRDHGSFAHHVDPPRWKSVSSACSASSMISRRSSSVR